MHSTGQQEKLGRVNRPRGAIRHYAGLLSPEAAATVPLLLARNREQRLHRLRAAVADRARQRLRPSRAPMRALQAAPGGRLSWRSVPSPRAPGPDGAIVHPIAASTCDLDCPIVLGLTKFALPLHLGHECVAEVMGTGERVQTVKPGDRVVVPFQISCGLCPPCKAGLTGSCTAVPQVSMYGMGLAAGHWGGAFSELLAVPYADAMLVALPQGVDPVLATGLADNICDAYRHVAGHLPGLLKDDPDALVLILGATGKRSAFGSSCALYTGLIARALGARNVLVADARPDVRSHAERLGLEAVHPRRLRNHPGAPLLVDMSVGDVGRALSLTAPDGVCSSAGSLHTTARIPTLQMYVRNATLHLGRTHVRALISDVLNLLGGGALPLEQLITTEGRLDDAPRLLREHFLAGGLKAVLTE